MIPVSNTASYTKPQISGPVRRANIPLVKIMVKKSNPSVVAVGTLTVTVTGQNRKGNLKPRFLSSKKLTVKSW